jgi:hypothetical protein
VTINNYIVYFSKNIYITKIIIVSSFTLNFINTCNSTLLVHQHENKWFIMTSYVGLIDRNILGQNHVLTNYPRRHFRRIFSIWLNKFNAIFTRLGLRSRGFWCRLQHYQIAWLGKIMGSVLIKEGTVLHMLM